ncbi:MAG: AAA family ATPase [Bacteroidales bacterium]|nr:AAA family ATPase [Bacteroidales bacterium]
MDLLFAKHDRLIANTSLDMVRAMIERIHWNSKLISIQGAKGVGKSTLLKQFVKLNYKSGDRKALYCSAATIDFSRRTLVGLVGEFVMNGGERLIIDEIHKYEGWSREIKEIYDLYPELKVAISGSSLLSFLAGDADLSRRCIKYTM